MPLELGDAVLPFLAADNNGDKVLLFQIRYTVLVADSVEDTVGHTIGDDVGHSVADTLGYTVGVALQELADAVLPVLAADNNGDAVLLWFA